MRNNLNNITNMMIIVAPYPDPTQPKDGFLARIAYIDEIFSDQEKTYLWLDSKMTTLKPKHGRVAPNIEVAYANPWNPVHVLWIIRLAMRANLCYFHSVYKTVKLWYLLLMKKCVVDLHGLAAEELEMMGHYSEIPLLKITERYAMSHAYRVISVTETMAEYIQSKYPKKKINFIILPIFENKKQFKSEKEIEKLSKLSKLPIVYSGTASVWQAVDRMVSLIKKTASKYSYTILTPDQKIFNEKIKDKNVEIIGVPKEKVYDYYAKNLFGIVIRKDNIVNTVSCPTKLIEYMATSVLPIVEYTSLGDFERLGYKYITVKDIVEHKIPNNKEIIKMLAFNQKIVDKLLEQTKLGIKELRKVLN
jgi:hypothetical protein